MVCPICNGYLIDKGAWGYLASHQSGEVLGHTFICSNAEGFNTKAQAIEYLHSTDQSMDDLGVTEWEEITCDSSMHSVSGSFYTDKQGDLHSGYPC